MSSTTRKSNLPEAYGKLLSPRVANPKSPRPLRSALLGSDIDLCPRSPTPNNESHSQQNSLHLVPIEINEPLSLIHGPLPGKYQIGRRHSAEDSDRSHLPAHVADSRHIDIVDHKNQRMIQMPTLNLNRAHESAAYSKSTYGESARDADVAHQETARMCRTRCPDWPRQVYPAGNTPRSAGMTVVAARSPRGIIWNAVSVRAPPPPCTIAA